MRDQISHQFAIEFEERYGLNGIAGRYVFPEEPGFDRLTLQHKVWEIYDTEKHPALLDARVQQFAAALNHPVTLEQIRENDQVCYYFATFMQHQELLEMLTVYEKLAALNPQAAAQLRFDKDDSKEVLDVVHGMVSGFSPEDINHYLESFRHEGGFMALEQTPKEQARMVLTTRIKDQIGDIPSWRPATSTLEKIWEQVKQRSPEIDTGVRQP